MDVNVISEGIQSIMFVFIPQLRWEMEHGKKAWSLERDDLETSLQNTKRELEESYKRMRSDKLKLTVSLQCYQCMALNVNNIFLSYKRHHPIFLRDTWIGDQVKTG